jgi:predicted DNA-binding transcriptional regulator AlpA
MTCKEQSARRGFRALGLTSNMNSTPSSVTIGSVPNVAAAHHLPGRLLKLPEVLRIIPVSRSTWYDGVKSGRYPKGARISKRRVAWCEADILALAASWFTGRD